MLAKGDRSLCKKDRMTSKCEPLVLLIGGMGFIGHYLVRTCRAAGMGVRVADMVLPTADAAEHGVEYLQGDYRDEAFLRRIVDGADKVVHLAHDTMLLNLDCNMDGEFERNIRPATRLMDICCDSGVAKLVFVSSGGTVYGNNALHKAIPEDAPKHPISIYGVSKLMIEQVGFLYHIQKHLPFVVARPGNAYGPGQLPFRGQGFVATAFGSSLESRPLTIFGDGSIVRDYIHALDIADALVALLLHGRAGESYNVGTALGTSLEALINNYIAPIIATDGHTLACKYEPGRRADVTYNVLANDKLLCDTGFYPRIKLADGMRETWEWLKKTHPHSKIEQS